MLSRAGRSAVLKRAFAMMMRELRQIDFKVYVQAFKTYARNPIIALAPFCTALINAAFKLLGWDLGGIIWIFSLFLDLFGLAVAIIAADYAWRYNAVRFDQIRNDARRKLPEILAASAGIVFVMFFLSLLGGIVGSLMPIFQAIAYTFVIYTLQAAAVGGTPGSAALQTSVDRTRAHPAASAILFLICYAANQCSNLLGGALLEYLGSSVWGAYYALVEAVVAAFAHGLAFGYIASAITGVSNNLSYGRRF